MTLGLLEPQVAWPEFFATQDEMAFPTTDADMSEFQWEEGTTPESYEDDLAAIMSASERITLTEREDLQDPEPPPESSPDVEWT